MQDKTRESDEWVEEEEMVVVELSGIIDPEYLSKCQNSNLKVLGIETEEPVLQLGSYIFSGQHKNMLGTAVLFEETQGSKAPSSETLQWQYKCHTVNRIEMQRVHLKSKQTTQDAAKTSSRDEGNEELQPRVEPEGPT